jgi:hypothetical protein
MTITAAILEATLNKLGYKFFTEGDYNLNIIGIRNSSTGVKVTNAFDDYIAVAFKVAGVWGVKVWPCTVDNGAGTARVVCGQYKSSHAIGLHQGKYEALRQVAPLTVERDYTKDGIYNATKKETGVFGINIHKAGVDSARVDNWSEGCQVFKKSADFAAFMLLAKKAATLHGNRFTYTLIESKDLVNLKD